MSALTVRPARAADLPALVRLNAELQDYERGLRPSRRSGHDVSADYRDLFRRALAGKSPDETLFVAETAAGIIGFVRCMVDEDLGEAPPDEVLIEDLVVTDGHRGTGVGRALVGAVADFARGHGIGRLVVATLVVNRGAIAAYEALGFRPAVMTFERAVDP